MDNRLPEIIENADYATFVNVFICEPADQEEVVRINAEIVDRVASGSPGFISASIHRSTDGTGRASSTTSNRCWREHLARIQRSTEFRDLSRQFAGLIEFEPHQCEVVHVRQAR